MSSNIPTALIIWRVLTLTRLDKQPINSNETSSNTTASSYNIYHETKWALIRAIWCIRDNIRTEIQTVYAEINEDCPVLHYIINKTKKFQKGGQFLEVYYE